MRSVKLMLVSTAQNEEEGALKEATEKAEDVHPSKDVIIAGV